MQAWRQPRWSAGLRKGENILMPITVSMTNCRLPRIDTATACAYTDDDREANQAPTSCNRCSTRTGCTSKDRFATGSARVLQAPHPMTGSGVTGST